MTAPALLAAVLVAAALAGPRLIHASAPILMRAPRLAVLLLTGSLVLWLLASASLSLVLAWMFTGPALLPAPFAEVCRRCLDAASPFTALGTVETSIPVVLLVAFPAVTAVVMFAFGVARWVSQARAARVVAGDIAGRAWPGRIGGSQVLVLDDDRPSAFSLPARVGGIVVTAALERALTADELAAVLEHEHAHLRQHHHLIRAVLDALTWPLGWLPLARAVANAVPHYLEIAADDAARASIGTPALAGALLKLGTPRASYTTAPQPTDGLLHIAGPDRIGYLVSPPRIGTAVLPTWALGAQFAAFALVAAAVHGPYLYVVLAGCHLPA